MQTQDISKVDKSKIKVAVGMSGGVDSSVAAALLKKEGYDVIGIFMKYWSDPSIAAQVKASNKCCSVDAFEDGRRVSDVLDIPIYTLNFSDYFKKEIVEDFISEYKKGRTPNPCVKCNELVKFGMFWQKAKDLGCDYIATGHYARIEHREDGSHLYMPTDEHKDQTYFLYRLKQEVLQHVLFPLAGYTKDQVRKMAEEMGIPVAHKEDSQEICFVGDKKHYKFLSRHVEKHPGDFVMDGVVVGQHEGLAFYTLGQRNGLEIQQPSGPFYVVGFDVDKNQVLVSNDPEHPALFNDEMYVENLSWTQSEPEFPQTFDIRIRYRHEPLSGVIEPVGENRYKIQLDKKIRAITPGQSAVFFKGDEIMGGGIITK